MKVPNRAALWLYGSYARGDRDAFSDVDLLVVGMWTSVEKALAWDCGGAQLSASHYSWDEIHEMVAVGSLFLHHVRLEGIPIAEGRRVRGDLGAMLKELRPYRHGSRDCRIFREALADIRQSLAGQGSVVFEMACLSKLMRNVAVLSCYMQGAPAFGRYEPIRNMVEHFDLPVGIADEFPKLYASRFRVKGDFAMGMELSSAVAERWLERAELLLEVLERQEVL